MKGQLTTSSNMINIAITVETESLKIAQRRPIGVDMLYFVVVIVHVSPFNVDYKTME